VVVLGMVDVPEVDPGVEPEAEPDGEPEPPA
jgi:hypothetical protein